MGQTTLFNHLRSDPRSQRNRSARTGAIGRLAARVRANLWDTQPGCSPRNYATKAVLGAVFVVRPRHLGPPGCVRSGTWFSGVWTVAAAASASHADLAQLRAKHLQPLRGAVAVARPIDRVRDALTQRGCLIRGRMAHCPAHDDGTPSLSIKERDDGAVLLNCFAGCALAEILEALGLEFPHLFPEETWPEHMRPSDAGLGINASDASPLSRSPVPHPRPVPSPGVRKEVEGAEAELYGLLAEFSRGELQPVVVRFPPPPPTAPPEAVHVAEHMALCIGLRRKVLEDRPLPYATSFCARENGLRDKRHASRVLRWLEDHRIFVCVGTMPRRPGGPPDGTKLYQPGVLSGLSTPPRGIEPFQAAQLGEEGAGLNPPIELDDQLPVEGAQTALVPPGSAVGVVASAHDARLTHLHQSDRKPRKRSERSGDGVRHGEDSKREAF